MSRYEPKAFPQYAGLGKVITFVSLMAGVLGALLGLLIEIVAPSWPLLCRIAIALTRSHGLDSTSSGRSPVRTPLKPRPDGMMNCPGFRPGSSFGDTRGAERGIIDAVSEESPC
jgi:hypothetical protein